MMDYKYIEQLLDNYFDCTTTLQEEQILRSFFSQEDVPGHLAQYADLFKYETEAKDEALGEEFDQRMLALVEEKEDGATKGHLIKMTSRHLAPFFKAAAVVAWHSRLGVRLNMPLASKKLKKIAMWWQLTHTSRRAMCSRPSA